MPTVCCFAGTVDVFSGNRLAILASTIITLKWMSAVSGSIIHLIHHWKMEAQNQRKTIAIVIGSIGRLIQRESKKM